MDRLDQGQPLMGGLLLRAALYLAHPCEHCHHHKLFIRNDCYQG